MKFSNYIINEVFDKVGKTLEQIDKNIQKTNKCEDLKKVIENSMKEIKKVNKGIGAGIEFYLKDYSQLIRKIGTDFVLNAVNSIQQIQMNIDSPDDKNKEEFRKIEKSIRDDFDILRNYVNKQHTNMGFLEAFFEQQIENLNKIIKIKNKVMK